MSDESQNNKDREDQDITDNQNPEEIQSELSQVSFNPTRNLFVIMSIALIGLLIIYFLFFSGTDSEKSSNDVDLAMLQNNQNNNTPDRSNSNIPAIPQLPSTPKMLEPAKPPEPEMKPRQAEAPKPKFPSQVPSLPTDIDEENKTNAPKLPSARSFISSDEEKAQKEKRMRSGIVKIRGNDALEEGDPELKLYPEFIRKRNRNYLLNNGKVIDAVLETPLNTDFGGDAKAIVSRDVYAEQGKNILIPKGSKIYGTYNTGIDGTYGRVGVAWTGIDLPSGYHISLDSIAVDNLGRKGIAGRIDQKYREKLTNAVLVSGVKILLGNGLDRIVKPVDDGQAKVKAQQKVTSLRTTTTEIFTRAGPANGKWSEICTATKNAIEDTTSDAWKTAESQCNTIQQNLTATPEERLNQAMNMVNQVADQMLTVSVNAAQPSKAQQSAQEGYDELSNLITEMLSAEQFNTTVSVDQGAAIKIYVRKDYSFPASVVNKNMVWR